MSFKGSVLRAGAMAAAVWVGLAATSAYACKGGVTLLRDDFSEDDPAWGLTEQSQAQISGGSMKVNVDPGRVNYFVYQGQNFPGADACVDVVFPPTPQKFAQAGLGIWNGRFWDFIYIQPDGQAGVSGLQNNAWVRPVPPRKADSIKTAPGAVNQLRVVWKAPPADNSNESPDPIIQVFINDKPFVRFKVPPNADRAISLFADTEGLVYQFKNLNVTQ